MSDQSDGMNELTPRDAAQPAPARVFVKGDTVPGLNSWLLDRKLGGGGFGEVWLARHAWNAAEKPRAVKFCTDPDARHRLVTHERNVVLRVMKYARNHPNVVPLLECNLDGETPWLMYEYVEGGTLAGVIEQWRELSRAERLGRAVRTLHAIAGALAQFHRFDPPLVHRDLKPQNVLMAGSVPRITDFGIGSVVVPADDGTTVPQTADAARLPAALSAAGTRIYAAPERLLGSGPNPRDDVYALGVIAYQMATADTKVVPGTDASLELRDLKVPDVLVSLIVNSVATNTDRRPKDAGEWETVLAELLRNEPGWSDEPGPTDPGSEAVLLPEPKTDLLPTEPLPLAPQPTAAASRNRVPPWALALVLFGAAVGATGFYYATRGRQSDPTPPAPDEAKGGSPLPDGRPPEGNGATGGMPLPKPGDTREFALPEGVSMTFCWVPGGESQLGSPKSERDLMSKLYKLTDEPGWLRDEAEERRGPFRTRGLWMGRCEVTQAEWAAVMRAFGAARAAPSFFRVGGKGADKLGPITDTSRFPVETVSWNECQQFLEKLRALPGARGCSARGRSRCRTRTSGSTRAARARATSGLSSSVGR